MNTQSSKLFVIAKCVFALYAIVVSWWLWRNAGELFGSAQQVPKPTGPLLIYATVVVILGGIVFGELLSGLRQVRRAIEYRDGKSKIFPSSAPGKLRHNAQMNVLVAILIAATASLRFLSGVSKMQYVLLYIAATWAVISFLYFIASAIKNYAVRIEEIESELPTGTGVH